jgi:uncharacterized protein (DUF924 family)
VTPQQILDFWTSTIGEQRWYKGGPDVDERIREDYRAVWQDARAGRFADWEHTPQGALALLIVLDQFPRNMFRGTAEAFASDAHARGVADRAISRGFDLKIEPPIRQFFYLPFEHSEDMQDQDRSLALFAERLGTDHYTYPYAVEHRAEIQKFGRFPSRNTSLGRASTAEEADFLGRKT